jgi:succinate dehydrogenase/fumarate reductase flavoprotein subunit
VHFADTMRGGQYVNNWRMAELHAKEAPDRVRELEAWGAVFDRTPDGRIISATSAATAIRVWRTSATARVWN